MTLQQKMLELLKLLKLFDISIQRLFAWLHIEHSRCD